MFGPFLPPLVRRMSSTTGALVPAAAGRRLFQTQRSPTTIPHRPLHQPLELNTNASRVLKGARCSLVTSTLVSAETSTPSTGGGGSSASGGGGSTEVHRRLNSLETKMDSGHVRSHSAMQELTTQVQRMRAILEEANEREIKTENELKKVTASNYLTTTLFLVYLFGVSTWMVILLNDLSGHIHGIPVVRMIHTRHNHPASKVSDGPVQPVDPADMRDIDTQMQAAPTYDATTSKPTK